MIPYIENDHRSDTTARPHSRVPIGRWLCIFLFCILLWPLVTTAIIQAQSDDGPGTIPGGTIPGNKVIFLPIVAHQDSGNPTPTPTPTVNFDLIPIAGPAVDRPPASHPDLNLALRSYISTTGELSLVDINGDTDSNAPQLVHIFAPPRVPTFTAVYRVYDWDWQCAPAGCRGNPLDRPQVTLLAVATTPGEALHIPARSPNIHAGDYKAMVLYAESSRITLTYTRDDTAAVGYLVHLEDIVVHPALLTLYKESHAAGRSHLPALRNGEPFATAAGNSIKIAIRDTGTFMDPRSRKDWWMGFIVN